MELSRKNKQKVFNELKTKENAFGQSDGYDNIMNFLNSIWDLDSMPSTDDRFTTANLDIYQHIINNNDWDIDYLFIQRLELLKNNDVFIKFLETVVSPKFKSSIIEIEEFVKLINDIIESDGYALAIVDYENNSPIYNIVSKELIGDLPIDIKINDIPFFVQKVLNGPSHRFSSHEEPKVFPSFVLAFNDGWNDFSLKNSFDLFYYDTERKSHIIGPIKIITTKSEVVLNELPDEFTFLDESYCSLGQKMSFYLTLYSLFGKKSNSICYALRDAAINSDVHDKFEKSYSFRNSIIRYDTPERLLREAKFIVSNREVSAMYKFDYIFTPKYSDEAVNVKFDFDAKSEVPNRLYALIGMNGTGKTQLLTSLPSKLSTQDAESFNSEVPLFSKIISVSYSVFDNFEIPKKTALVNYVHCGLRNEKGDFLSNKGLVLRFHSTWKKIKTLERMPQWRRILLKFIEESIVDAFIIKIDEDGLYDVSIEGFNNARAKLSSGQSITLYIITEIVANIRYDSLLLYDEPETHLHPNAITQLMNTIYELLNEFESYCIVATHSPLVIREILSSVYVVERHENVPSIRKIGREPFGEDISILTDDVFGNRNTDKPYKLLLKKMVENGKSYEQIINLLETDNLSLDSKLYLKALTNE